MNVIMSHISRKVAFSIALVMEKDAQLVVSCAKVRVSVDVIRTLEILSQVGKGSTSRVIMPIK
jgi:hypothetical protein